MGDFVELLGSGREHGCKLTYRVQDEAGGIAQALGLAELFCAGARCVVILGDNIFHDPLGPMLTDAAARPDHAWVALKQVPDPGRYGVAELTNGNPSSASRRSRRSRRAIWPWPASTSTRRTCLT